jgi:hypothetical protein
MLNTELNIPNSRIIMPGAGLTYSGFSAEASRTSDAAFLHTPKKISFLCRGRSSGLLPSSAVGSCYVRNYHTGKHP